MDSATIEKVATTAVIAGAAFLASKIFETGWKITTKRPVPAEDADDVTLTSLVIFAATSAALAAVAQRYARAAGGAPGPCVHPTRSRASPPRPRPT